MKGYARHKSFLNQCAHYIVNTHLHEAKEKYYISNIGNHRVMGIPYQSWG